MPLHLYIQFKHAVQNYSLPPLAPRILMRARCSVLLNPLLKRTTNRGVNDLLINHSQEMLCKLTY